MENPSPLTRVTLFLPRLSDDDSHYFGQGDPELAWANLLVGAVGAGAVDEIGATQTLLVPERDLDGILLRLMIKHDLSATLDGILVDRRFWDADLPDLNYVRYEALETVEVAMAAKTVEEVEAVIEGALPFREYRIAWAKGIDDDDVPVRARV